MTISKSEQKRLDVQRKQVVSLPFILDRSGSMADVRDETIVGFNKFLETTKAEKNVTYLFSLALFHSDPSNQPVIEQRYAMTPLEHVAPLTLHNYLPEGGTPLYDAIGKTIRNVEKTAADKYLVVIQTDGEENSSTEYSHEQIQGLIHDKEALGNWTFLFLSSSLKAKSQAQKIGIQAGNVGRYNNADVGRVFMAAAGSVNNYSSSLHSHTSNFMKEYKTKGLVAADDFEDDQPLNTNTTTTEAMVDEQQEKTSTAKP